MLFLFFSGLSTEPETQTGKTAHTDKKWALPNETEEINQIKK